MPLSPEANQVLYSDQSGNSLEDQLQAALARNANEGIVVLNSLASVASAALAAAEANESTDTSFNMNNLSERQRSVAESILDQFESSYEGLNDVGAALNRFVSDRHPVTLPEEDYVMEELNRVMADWSKRGILDFVGSQIEQDPEQEYTLVITPTLTKEQKLSNKPRKLIQAGFKAFAEGQPNNTTEYIYDEYCEGYETQDIYGETTEAQGLSFSLVPTKYTEDIVSTDTVDSQKGELERFQEINPDLGAHVDSPLAQLTRLFTLRQQHGAEALEDFALTFSRNFDLPVVNGCVPRSCVDDVGNVDAGQYDAEDRDGSRVAVG